MILLSLSPECCDSRFSAPHPVHRTILEFVGLSVFVRCVLVGSGPGSTAAAEPGGSGLWAVKHCVCLKSIHSHPSRRYKHFWYLLSVHTLPSASRSWYCTNCVPEKRLQRSWGIILDQASASLEEVLLGSLACLDWSQTLSCQGPVSCLPSSSLPLLSQKGKGGSSLFPNLLTLSYSFTQLLINRCLRILVLCQRSWEFGRPVTQQHSLLQAPLALHASPSPGYKGSL